MAKSDTSPRDGSGVDALVEQLKQDGIDAGRQEAERIVREARAEADRLINQAREESQRTLAEGKQELERLRGSVEDALRQASRDLLLTLQTDLASRMRARITELCEEAMRDPAFLRSMLLAAVGREVPKDERMDVAASVLGAPPEATSSDDVATAWLAGELSELLREGVKLRAKAAGAPVLNIQLLDRDARVDVSPGALAELLWERMIPRFRHLLSFEE